MHKKPDLTGVRKRARKAGAPADLPAKPLKGKDAAAVKGGMARLELTTINAKALRLPEEWALSSPPTSLLKG